MNRTTGHFEVVGAEAALSFFGTLDVKRISHGYLFTGPAGVGKKTFGRALAQSLFCETPKPTLLGYCNACTGCKLFTAGTHPDFVFAEGAIKIGDESARSGDDQVTSRDLVREMSLHAYRSAYRVVLLGDVDFTGTHAAANALLKLFEEPPAGIVFLLTTSAAGSLLPTIRSRFVEIPFSPLATRDVERVLVRSGVDEERAHFAAEASLGSITRARAILDDDDLGIREKSFVWFEDAVRGKQPDGSFLSLDDKSLSGAEKRRNVGELIELSRIAVRDWAALTLAPGADVPVLASDQRARIAGLPGRDPAAIVNLLASLADVERVANTNVSAGLVVDYLRMQLSPR